MLMTAQYRWVGHVTRMEDTRLPKITFYSELEHGTRSHCGQLKRYKDICWRQTREPAICLLTSSRTSRQTSHPGGPHLRSRCVTLSAAVYCQIKTSVFNARPVVSYRQIADSPVTPAVVSVHQGSVSSLTNELVCHPGIRRVDGSVHPIHPSNIVSYDPLVPMYIAFGAVGPRVWKYLPTDPTQSELSYSRSRQSNEDVFISRVVPMRNVNP